MAENAATNGAEFYLNHAVTAIKACESGYRIEAGDEVFEAAAVVNAAGVCADLIHNMVSEEKLQIVPRRGEYRLMDKTSGDKVHSTIFQLPSKLGKGILVTPTVHGNLLVGPTAEDIQDKEDVATTVGGIHKVLERGSQSVTVLDGRQTITSFAMVLYMSAALGAGPRDTRRTVRRGAFFLHHEDPEKLLRLPESRN